MSNFAHKTLIPTLIPKNAVLGYKKGWNLKNYTFFVNLRRYLICVLSSIIAVKHPVKICIEKQIFLYRFMQKAEKCEKIPFLVTKSGQILNLMSGKVPRPQICGGFHLSESSSHGRNIPLEGGGEKRPFLPPPQLDSCQFEGLCLRM